MPDIITNETPSSIKTRIVEMIGGKYYITRCGD